MLEIKIKSEEKSYPILIENEDISSLREKIFSGLESYLAVISAKVEKLYGKELNIPKENIVLSLEAIVDPVSLYEPVFSDGSDTIYVMDQVGDKNDDSNWLDEISLKESIKQLGEREKTILSLRFFAGKTQMEVAEEIGISQAQVSRLEKCVLTKIKKQLG